MVRASAVYVMAQLTLFAPSALAHPCQAVRAAIDGQVKAETPPEVLLQLGPHFSRDALGALLDLGREGGLDRRIAAFGAFGLARHADGLRRLSTTEPPEDPEGRLAYALASLALGADSLTGTVAETMESGVLSTRRAAIRVLSRMKHIRPRRILEMGLEDPDETVRLVAAEALMPYRYRSARKVLVNFAESDAPALQMRAVRALLVAGHRFSPAFLPRLDADIAAEAYAGTYGRGTRLAVLKRKVTQRDPGVRAGVLGVVVAQSDATVPWFKRTCSGWARRYGKLGRGEYVMVLALLGDPSAQSQIAGLTSDAQTGALRVFSAFGATPRAETRIDTATVQRVLEGLEHWWPSLTETERARMLSGLAAVDAPTSLQFARRVLPQLARAPLVVAADVLRRHGTVDDAEALVNAVEGEPTLAHGPVLAAAARLCRLEAGG